MIKNMNELGKDELCVELHDVGFMNGGIYEMRMPGLIMLS